MGLLQFQGFRLKKYMNLAGSCIAMVNGECRAHEGRHILVSATSPVEGFTRRDWPRLVTVKGNMKIK